jgi:hypothetical protein
MSDGDYTLVKELNTFKRILPTLVGEDGRYALIAGDELIGIFDTYSDALASGYRARALEPFLVKQISTFEMIANFSRDLGIGCRTSQI